MKRTAKKLRMLIVSALIILPIQAFGQTTYEYIDEPIVANGTIAEECGFGPSVVSLSTVTGFCTGTLIHPEVILTAAHCGSYTQARFTHKMGEGRLAAIKECHQHPNYQGTNTVGWDFGYCLLETPVTDIPITPPAFGCEFDKYLKNGQEVTLCGFGYSTDSFHDGYKRFAESKIAVVQGSNGYGSIQVGPKDGVVACPGDSGGPLLVQIEDGSWRTIGVTSTYNKICGEGGVNSYAAIRTGVEWIEEETGIDVTPCFDIEGNWDPNDDCTEFWAGDATANGTWEDGCAGTPLSGPSDSCEDWDDDTGSEDTDTETDTDTADTDTEDTDTEDTDTEDTDTEDTDTEDTDTEPGDGGTDKEESCGCTTVGKSSDSLLGGLIFLNVLN